MPDLMGLKEIGELLGVTRARAHQLAQVEGFPDPLGATSAGRIWERANIEKWARDTGRLIKQEGAA